MKPRIVLVGTILLVAFGLMILRVGKLTILDRRELASRAQRQYVERIRTVESRGEILDREGVVLATTIAVPSIFASPRQHPIGAAERSALAAALQMPLDRLARQLDKDRGFVWLARGVSEEVADDVAALGLTGVGQVREGRRLYPHRSLAAHVIGTADRDLRGVEGIEKRYDRWMRGEELVFRVERDGLGRLLFSRGVEDGLEAPATTAGVEDDGLPVAPRATLSLSIDATLQSIVERELALGVENAQADAGVAIMLDPWTGAILALANVPTYDPNQPGPNDTRRNRALADRFEPGSTFKAFLAAAAVEERTLGTDERIDCENGRYRIGRWTIHDHHPYGLLTLPDVIKHSSNIGVSKIAARMGRDRFGDYVSRFGFGHKTGIDLPGEVEGTVRPVGRWADIDLATCSFGQGIAVTPIQITAAFAAIANGGKLVSPYLLERAVSPSNDVLFERNEIEQVAAAPAVVSRGSADAVVEMLERVVEEQGGTGGKARVAGVTIAGKTGTAQKVANGRYSKERLASFIGFAPSRDPAFVLLVMIDNPRKATYGGIVAAPVFSQISAQALDRLGRRPVSAGEEALPVKAGVRTAQAAKAQKVALGGAGPIEPQEVATGPAFATEPTIAPTEALPSFIGLSLRAARRRAAVEGLALMVRGSGFVKSQEPAAGTRRGDAPVVLVLEPSI